MKRLHPAEEPEDRRDGVRARGQDTLFSVAKRKKLDDEKEEGLLFVLNKKEEESDPTGATGATGTGGGRAWWPTKRGTG